MGVLFAGIAGIMIDISVDELLPTSRAYGKGYDSIYGLVVAGMAVMVLNLLLMYNTFAKIINYVFRYNI